MTEIPRVAQPATIERALEAVRRLILAMPLGDPDLVEEMRRRETLKALLARERARQR